MSNPVQYKSANADIQVLASKFDRAKDDPNHRNQEGTTLIHVQMSSAALERARGHWHGPTFIVETEIAVWLGLYVASEDMADEEALSVQLLETTPGHWFAWVQWFAVTISDAGSIEEDAQHLWNITRGV